MTCRPLPVRLAETAGGRRYSPIRRYATALLLALAAAGLAVVPAVADPGEIAAKRAEVDRVLGEINQLDVSLEQAVEAYDAATSKLEGIEQQQSVNRYELKIAKRNLKHERRALGRRLVAIYTSDTDTSTISVLLPRATTPSAVSSRLLLRRALTTTSHPASAIPHAIARPIPKPDPVTTATRSSIRNRSSRLIAHHAAKRRS